MDQKGREWVPGTPWKLFLWPGHGRERLQSRGLAGREGWKSDISRNDDNMMTEWDVDEGKGGVRDDGSGGSA